MIKSRIAVAGALFAAAGAAHADVTGNIALVSDYDFRGLTQTLNDPAFQLGITYEGDGGVYFGLWGSNVDFQGNAPLATISDTDLDRPSTEIDAFLGWSGGESVGYDVGVIYYDYPNAGHLNYPEVWAGVKKGPWSARAWYSWDFGGSGETTLYLQSDVLIPMAEDFSFVGHVGYSDGDVFPRGGYFDWAAGVQFDASNFSLSFKWVDGNDFLSTPKQLGRFVFGVSTTVPWGE